MNTCIERPSLPLKIGKPEDLVFPERAFAGAIGVPNLAGEARISGLQASLPVVAGYRSSHANDDKEQDEDGRENS
ncbi:hypothetical protein [Achromobacter denitrificans]|uniref:hypothetical protein n=1 Tax=Achromobacter denitrificans TaxID=32002 RepID=UPI002432B5CE|nr:hypothetical protein [Achromobacter denitrificans]MBV2161455.1 hypothetical protein [Achromobacter denitrificans]